MPGRPRNGRSRHWSSCHIHRGLQSLKSPVHATASGLFATMKELLLASCAKGKRAMLPSAMVCVGRLDIGDLPLAHSIGLGNPGPSLRDQARALVQAQLEHILEGLNLAPGLWQAPLVLSAHAAIKALAGTVSHSHAHAGPPAKSRKRCKRPTISAQRALTTSIFTGTD